jgi:uncharacterized iron-regulated membrane protein
MGNINNEQGSRTLFRIVGFSTALAFGAMVGSLFAVKSLPSGLSFELTPAAVIAFIVAGIVAWFYWRMVERMAAGQAPQQRRRRFALFSIALLAVGIVSFLYPLKFIPREKRGDVFIGLALAAGCITGVGFVMWKVRRFLEADQKQTEAEDRDSD